MGQHELKMADHVVPKLPSSRPGDTVWPRLRPKSRSVRLVERGQSVFFKLCLPFHDCGLITRTIRGSRLVIAIANASKDGVVGHNAVIHNTVLIVKKPLEVKHCPSQSVWCAGLWAKTRTWRIQAQCATNFTKLNSGHFTRVAALPMVVQTSNTTIFVRPAPIKKCRARATSYFAHLRCCIADAVESHGEQTRSVRTVVGCLVCCKQSICFCFAGRKDSFSHIR